jgi:Mrp family chromosome partitioning ATPase
MSFCLRDYDITIVDTPPANACSDVHRVSTVAGYSLIIAGRHRTLVSDVRTLISQLESDRARVIGTVMTEA